MNLQLPALRETARIEDPTYDGIGTNVAIIFFGWLPALVISPFLTSLLLIVEWWRSVWRTSSRAAPSLPPGAALQDRDYGAFCSEGQSHDGR
jgi:hypothetical protein